MCRLKNKLYASGHYLGDQFIYAYDGAWDLMMELGI